MATTQTVATREQSTTGLLYFLLVLAGIGVIVSGYDAIDRAGWITHTANVPIHFPAESWLIGEFRNCTTYRAGVDLGGMDCWTGVAGQGHVLPVKFHGRIDRKDHMFYTWRCQRQESGFWHSAAMQCWALD